MPVMTYTPSYFSEPSQLIEGVHPAFLVAITDDLTPPTWPMAQKSPRMYRWHFAVLHSLETFEQYQPERQTGITSQIFSGGKQPSKSYTWSCAILGRDIPADESVDLDPMMPLPCQLFIGRHDKAGKSIEWANVDKVYNWADGHRLLTEPVRQRLADWWAKKQAEMATAEGPSQPAPQPAPRPSPPMYQPPVQQPLAAAPAPAPAPASNGTPATPAPAPAPEKKGW